MADRRDIGRFVGFIFFFGKLGFLRGDMSND